MNRFVTPLLVAASVALSAAVLVACDDAQTTTCGAGTSLVGQECVADPPTACGAGTVLDQATGECLPETPGGGGAECGPGTALDNDGKCVVSDPGALCQGETVYIEALGGCYASEVLVGDCAIGVGTTLSADITTDTTLTAGCYYVPSPISVGANLLIEAGARLVFGENSAMTIANAGAIQALGTTDSPIEMVGEETSPGFWSGLSVDSDQTDNRIENVLISNAGGIQGSGALALYHQPGGTLTITVDAVTLDAFGVSGGLFVDEFVFATISGLTLSNGTGTPAITHVNTRDLLPGDTVFESNDVARVQAYGRNIRHSRSWAALSVPTLLDNGEVVIAGNDSGHLTLEPGVELRFAENSRLVVPTGAALTAIGTADAPIVLAGDIEAAGSWMGIQFDGSSSVNNALEHVQVQHAGALGVLGCVSLENLGSTNALTVRNLSIDSCAVDALYVDQGTSFEALEGLQVTKTLGAPATMHITTVHYLDGASAALFAGSADKHVNVLGGTLPAGNAYTWDALDTPYRIFSPVAVGGDLTIQAGARIQFVENASLSAYGGTLNAVGTVQEPIVFEGDEDLTAFWSGITFRDTASVNNRLEHVFIRNAGGAETFQAGIVIREGGAAETDLDLVNVTIEMSSPGIYYEGAAQITECSDVTFVDTTPEVVGDGASLWDTVCP